MSGLYYSNYFPFKTIDYVNWSKTTSWSNSIFPITGEDVVIPFGKTFLMDISTPDLNSLTISGTLLINDDNLTIRTKSLSILSTGYLSVESIEIPIVSNRLVLINV